MLESLKITKRCNKFLKNYNINLNMDVKIFRANALIHCQVKDTRGMCEVEGFPVANINDAVEKIIEASLLNHFIKEEIVKRDELKKGYINEKIYDFRKYVFEEILKIVKHYSKDFYRRSINKYLSLLNLEKEYKWEFDIEKEIFKGKGIV